MPAVSVISEKDVVRWELAEVNNKLNRLLKLASLAGPHTRISSTYGYEILELRGIRDKLLTKLQEM